MKKETLGFYNDPTDTVEEVKEFSPEEIYYNSSRERDEVEEAYVTSLERKLKSKNKALSELFTVLSGSEHLDFYSNKVNQILKI